MEAQQRDEEPVPRRDIVAEAEATAIKLAKLNGELAEKIQRLEALRVEETLGGRASVQVQQKEESPTAYAERVLRGEVDDE